MNQLKRNESFDGFAEEYDLYRPRYPQDFARNISDKIGIIDSATILEIGCGTGQDLKQYHLSRNWRYE